MRIYLAAAAAFFAASTTVFAQEEISFAFTDDDPAYIEEMGNLVQEFEQKNPDIKVKYITAGYSQLMEQLPLQLSVGKGPDLAKITDTTLMKYTLDLRPYMQDPDGFATFHGNSLKGLTIDGDPANKIGGFMLSKTINLPFVNKTLWDQAGIPLPKQGATLDQIVEDSLKVAQATGVDIPFTIDRSGNRFLGPAFSYGSHLLKDGQLSFPDEASKKLIADFQRWSQEGAFPKEMWGAAGGTRYKNMSDEFINGNVVTYFSGNWIVNPFIAKIGSDFDWTALDAPCGDGGCIAMQGGTYLAAFKSSHHPKAVARLVEFLGSPEVVRKLAERFIIIPGATGIHDLTYQLSDPSATSAMKVFLRNSDAISPEAIEWMSKPGQSAVQGYIVQRVSQMIVGELTLQETYDRLESDVAKINETLKANKKD